MTSAPAYTHRLTVRFRDCDMLGHVNNAVYFTYFEEARVAWWRQLESRGTPRVHTVVVLAECDYRSPALLHETLEIEVRLVKVGSRSASFGYRIVDTASGRLVAEGASVSVAIDPETKAAVPVPDAWRRSLEQAERPGA